MVVARGPWRSPRASLLMESRHRTVSRCAAAVSIGIGSLVLIGWLCDIGILKSLIPGTVTMKPNAAIGLVLCGVSLWFVSRTSPASDLVAKACAVSALLLGAAVCFQYVTRTDLGIDQLLFAEPVGTVGTFSPGRIAPATAISFVLLGLALLVCRVRRFQTAVVVISLIVALFSLVAMTTYLFRVQGNDAIHVFTRLAFHTAIALTVLSGGVAAFVSSQRAPMQSRFAAAILPRLLPAVIVVPLLAGWLRLQGERLGFYSSDFGVVLMVAGTVTLLALLVWWSVRALTRMDAERSAAEEALRSEERRTRQIIESAHDAFISMDANGNVTDWNPRAEAMFGFAKQDVIGRRLCELIIPERYRERHREGLKRFLASGNGPVLGKPVEISALHADRREFPVELTISPMQWGDTWLFNAFIHDISERKEKDALAVASAAKDHFIAVLSHELRTPLTPVLTTILDLEAEPNLEPPVREALQLIQRNVQLEARLIDDLLDVTRLAKGKLQIERRIVSVNSVLQDALGVCKSELLKKKVRVDFDAQAPNATVEGDAPRLMQVFWNLLQNAVKFTPPGGQIAVRTRASDERLLTVEIEDTGIGMSPEVLSRIFTPFEQADPTISRRFGGLGLGLALSKALVEAHGGKIEATSLGEDRGTVMRVELQTVDAPVPPTSSTLSHEPDAFVAFRILIVEDHADTRRTLDRLLTRWGHDVTTAADLATARGLLASQNFDLLLTDLGLPDGHGTELMAELRAQGSTIPGIALSGFGTEADAARSVECGFAAHFTKPVGTQNLREQINSIARASLKATGSNSGSQSQITFGSGV